MAKQPGSLERPLERLRITADLINLTSIVVRIFLASPSLVPVRMSLQSRPRVLLVGQMPPTKGGQTTFMLNLMASYLSANFEFIPYTTTRPPKKNVVDNWGYGAMFRGGPLRAIYGIVLTAWRLLLFPFVVIARRIDLVQVQASDYQVFWESVAYVVAARIVARPAVLRIGGAFDLFHGASAVVIKKIIAACLRLPQCLIVQSRFAYDYVQAAGRTSDIVILPNWIQDTAVSNVARPLRENPVFMFIGGSEARRKGIEEIIEAASLLDAIDCPARFHLVAMVPRLIERIEKLQLKNIAKIEGMVEHARMLEIMAQDDVFLLPSHGEGFPNSLVEAMGAGMPSIVTPVSAVPEIIIDGGALLVPVGDAAALAKAIERLAVDHNLRQELGRQAQANVFRKYTEATALPPLAAGYNHLLKNLSEPRKI
jgi:glycosyltransferase involved in cell wall biosynthesis